MFYSCESDKGIIRVVFDKGMKSGGGFIESRIRFIPHLFTLMNAFLGFCAIVFTVEYDLIAAANCIFLGALMDILDGRTARYANVESKLGMEMDSLCDVVSFCLAPAFLSYQFTLRHLGFWGILASSVFLLSGILRLAKFNITGDKQSLFFIGIPTTIAGCFLTAVLLNFCHFFSRRWFALSVAFLMILLAWVMLSSIRFPAFKKKLPKAHSNLLFVFPVLLFAFVVVMQMRRILLLLFSVYFVFSAVCNLFLWFEK
jgi:CDP-diacylglycerol---serine O-phosphatidyltransferase